jgi:kynurenine formamidase
MREVPDKPLKPWRPPQYVVDEHGKVRGAEPGTPHNWGRWGAHDQRGTANLLTAQRALAAAGLVQHGRQFSLALPIGGPLDGPGTRPAALHTFLSAGSDLVVGDSGDFGLPIADDILLLPLQGSTQLDGLAHFARRDVLYNGFWAGLVTAAHGARRLGIHHLAAGIVGRGVLLDVSGVLGIDSFEVTITAEMLQHVADQEGVEVRAGDIVLVRTGYLGAWMQRPEVRGSLRQSGLALDTIPWLHDADVALVASDNNAVERIPAPAGSPGVLPWHAAALCDLGLLVGELFDLDELAMDCSTDGVYEFMFLAAPLPVVNGVGTPLNPVVLK